jgi:hypothetical protein
MLALLSRALAAAAVTAAMAGGYAQAQPAGKGDTAQPPQREHSLTVRNGCGFNMWIAVAADGHVVAWTLIQPGAVVQRSFFDIIVRVHAADAADGYWDFGGRSQLLPVQLDRHFDYPLATGPGARLSNPIQRPFHLIDVLSTSDVTLCRTRFGDGR